MTYLQPHRTTQKIRYSQRWLGRVKPVNRRKEDKVIPPGRRNKANRGMDAESSRPQADCPEVNAVRSTGCPRKTGLLRGGPLNTFTSSEATLTTPLQVNGTFTTLASAQSERNFHISPGEQNNHPSLLNPIRLIFGPPFFPPHSPLLFSSSFFFQL